jgi:NitT/TauT family transport system substrate-binding protein
MQWGLDNPKAAGEMVAKHIALLTPEAVADSIEITKFDVVPALQAKAELEFFYRQLMQNLPDLVGGKLPDNGFYYTP